LAPPEAMGGQIEAGNRTDRQGAVFTITFPIGSEPLYILTETGVTLPSSRAHARGLSR
jgi:hypothetical protein